MATNDAPTAPPEEEKSDIVLRVVLPTAPYVGFIPGGLKPGYAITIKGSVSFDGSLKRFWIDLCCGLLVQGDHQDNKALHFNPRFQTGSWIFGSKDTQIVLNSLVNNTWGTEERYGNVFKRGSPFLIRILVLLYYYKIAINDRHLCDYSHRLGVNTVTSIYVGGDVSIDYIEVQGKTFCMFFSYSSHSPDYSNENWNTLECVPVLVAIIAHHSTELDPPI